MFNVHPTEISRPPRPLIKLSDEEPSTVRMSTTFRIPDSVGEMIQRKGPCADSPECLVLLHTHQMVLEVSVPRKEAPWGAGPQLVGIEEGAGAEETDCNEVSAAPRSTPRGSPELGWPRRVALTWESGEQAFTLLHEPC